MRSVVGLGAVATAGMLAIAGCGGSAGPSGPPDAWAPDVGRTDAAMPHDAGRDASEGGLTMDSATDAGGLDDAGLVLDVGIDAAVLACSPGATQGCYGGPVGTAGIGICHAGTKTCASDGSAFGACTGDRGPASEDCSTPEDDDCDGTANELDAGCVCVPGASASCYGGPSGTERVGACVAGTRTCASDGLGFGTCTGDVQPVAEDCATSVDDDCDGSVDEGCACAPGSSASCYSGAAGTGGVGPCHAGSHTCLPDGSGYGACTGEVAPVAETCTTLVDDDCDGMVNESGVGCVCTPSSTQPCYDGMAGTSGIGACHGGTATCSADGTSLGACVGEVTPVAETCTTLVDDDCDGMVNESGTGCVCVPSSAEACYSGAPATQGVGPCRGGTHTCNLAGTAYGTCNGEVVPAAETCATPIDDDCDGMVNESGAFCVCTPSSTSSCYDGPTGTSGVGLCQAGMHTCSAFGTSFGACTGQVTPTVESCGTPGDDDCDGSTTDCTITYASDAAPVLARRCSTCHTGGGSGGTNFGSSYVDSQASSLACPGLTVGACTLVRIQNGSMPAGAGCSGNPASDAANPSCLTAGEQAILQAWISGGQLP